MQSAALFTVAAKGGISDGFIAWLNGFFSQIAQLGHNAAIAIAVIFVIVSFCMSRFSTTALLMSAVLAGAFLWIVFHVNDLQDGVDKDVNKSGTNTSAAVLQVPEPIIPGLT